jgi:TolB protein
MRTRGATREVQRIGPGHPGIGATVDRAGSRVLYTSLGTATEAPRLMVLASVNAESRAFTDDVGSYEREADWSPSGDRVAYTSLRDEGFGDVFVARVTGGTFLGTANLTTANGGGGAPDMTPRWSPDGLHLAFTSYRGGNPSIWIMDADGGNPRRLTTPGDASDYFPTWSPAGDSIAFQRINATGSRIGLVAAAGGTPRFLTLPGDAFSPSWAPDAARLAITMRMPDLDLDIHVVGTDGTIVEHLRRAGRDYQPRWIASASRF